MALSVKTAGVAAVTVRFHDSPTNRNDPLTVAVLAFHNEFS